MNPPLDCIKSMTVENIEKKVQRGRARDDNFSRHALAHRDFLMRLARKLTGNVTVAEDLIQDTYLKAFRAFDRFEGETRCRAWLKKIMMNTYINMYNRKQKVIFFQRDNREMAEIPNDDVEHFPHAENIDEDHFLRNFVCDEIRDSILAMPNEYRMTLILYDMLGVSYKQISEMLGVPIGTVKSRLFRGRKSLKSHIEKNTGNGNNHKNGRCG